MKIETRKYTTTAGLAQAKELIAKIEDQMISDLNAFSSNDFNVGIMLDNGKSTSDYNYAKWEANKAYLRYKNGHISIKAYDDQTDYYCSKKVSLMSFHKFNFKAFAECLAEFIDDYNERTLAKDREISDFLSKVSSLTAE